VDAIRFGRAVRALRMRRRWRQVDLATAVGCSKALVWRVESGRGDRVIPRTLEHIAQALGARVTLRIDWNGEALDRLLDHDHSAIVDRVIRVLGDVGWQVTPETTFSLDGERGSVDILGWHAASGTLLVVEVKSVVPDIQAMVIALDRKVRLGPRIGLQHGWRAGSVASLLVIGDTRTSRRRVAAHAATFGSRFPDRIVAIRRFIANPAGRSLSGLWFLSGASRGSARHRTPGSSPAARAGRPSRGR
jgi:transcriptional regulator with XRE-family HTH domain